MFPILDISLAHNISALLGFANMKSMHLDEELE